MTIIIEWYCYEKNGRSCDRCNESRRAIQRAVERVSISLQERGFGVELREHKLDDDRIDQSNMVIINGHDLVSLLKEREGIFSYCRSCTEITGKPSECRTFIYRSRAYEGVPEDMVVEGILLAAGLRPAVPPEHSR